VEIDFSTSVASVGTSFVLSVVGDVDLASSDQLRNDIAPLLGSGRDLILDLAEVRFMDSSGIAVLLDARTKQLASGRSVFVQNPSNIVRRVLDATGLSGLLIDPLPGV